MRWGVRDEMTNEHMTTALCMNELSGCQKYSMGPNFIYFGAQKYGYRPIPSEIDTEELSKLIEVLETMGNDTTLLKKWYRKDNNKVTRNIDGCWLNIYNIRFLQNLFCSQ